MSPRASVEMRTDPGISAVQRADTKVPLAKCEPAWTRLHNSLPRYHERHRREYWDAVLEKARKMSLVVRGEQ